MMSMRAVGKMRPESEEGGSPATEFHKFRFLGPRSAIARCGPAHHSDMAEFRPSPCQEDPLRDDVGSQRPFPGEFAKPSVRQTLNWVSSVKSLERADQGGGQIAPKPEGGIATNSAKSLFFSSCSRPRKQWKPDSARDCQIKLCRMSQAPVTPMGRETTGCGRGRWLSPCVTGALRHAPGQPGEGEKRP